MVSTECFHTNGAPNTSCHAMSRVTNSNLFFSCRQRQRQLQLLWERALALSRKRRFGTRLPSSYQELWDRQENHSLQREATRRNPPGTNSPSLSTHLALRALSRPSKITTLSSFWLRRKPQSQQSKRLARTCTASRLEKWTLLSDQTDKRRLMLLLTSSMMLSKSQTRSESCEVVPSRTRRSLEANGVSTRWRRQLCK